MTRHPFTDEDISAATKAVWEKYKVDAFIHGYLEHAVQALWDSAVKRGAVEETPGKRSWSIIKLPEDKK